MTKATMTAVMAAVALGAFAEPVQQEAAKKAAPAQAEAKTDVIDLEEATAEGVKLKVNGAAGDQNALIDIDCDEATLADVLRQFRHAVGANIISGDSSAYSSFPVIGVKRLTTDFTMKDGSTAVIGGLSKTEEGDIDSGIPYLRHIPWIGPKLFGWKSRQKVQKEIIVCVTIGIANPADLPKDVGLPKNAVMGRQYVDGTKLEPGDRKDAAAELLKVDERALDGCDFNSLKK